MNVVKMKVFLVNSMHFISLTVFTTNPGISGNFGFLNIFQNFLTRNVSKILMQINSLNRNINLRLVNTNESTTGNSLVAMHLLVVYGAIDER